MSARSASEPAGSAPDPLRKAAQRVYDRFERLAGGEPMQDDIEALGAALAASSSEPEAPGSIIDPAWCDCPEGYPNYGIGKYKHLPSCRYGIVEDWLDSLS